MRHRLFPDLRNCGLHLLPVLAPDADRDFLRRPAGDCGGGPVSALLRPGLRAGVLCILHQQLFQRQRQVRDHLRPQHGRHLRGADSHVLFDQPVCHGHAVLHGTGGPGGFGAVHFDLRGASGEAAETGKWTGKATALIRASYNHTGSNRFIQTKTQASPSREMRLRFCVSQHPCSSHFHPGDNLW